MSADNGIHISKNEQGKYEVRSYCASIDYDDILHMDLISTEDTLETAIEVGQKENTEYGLSFSLNPELQTEKEKL